MEDIINISTFIQHLTYYIKIGIYINKGSTDEVVLDRCINLYNKYKTIEASTEENSENEIYVRRCLKRLNLILKVDENNKPIDVSQKENQLKMISLRPHPSIIKNDLKSMVEYATKNKINILTSVPLMFFLKENKYQEMLWQYTRSLFFISQLLISKSDVNDFNLVKKNVYDESMQQMEHILVSIADIDQKMKLNQLLALDKFLNVKLVKTGINETNVNEARQEVKNIFIKKGIGEDVPMDRMIDSIADKLTSSDFSSGNFLQSMFGIAKDVADEVKGDMEGDPNKFQNTIGAITQVFQDVMEDGSKNGDKMPPELKNMFQQIISVSPSEQNDFSQEELSKNLEAIAQSSGLTSDEFISMISGDNGDLDATKLENFFNKDKK